METADLGYGTVLALKPTGRHADVFQQVILISDGSAVFPRGEETRFFGLFVDDYEQPTKYGLANVYVPEEAEERVGQVEETQVPIMVVDAGFGWPGRLTPKEG